MDILYGLKNIGNGFYQVGEGILKTAWSFIKLLAFSIVVGIAGIFYVVQGVMNYAKRRMSIIKKERPAVIITQAGTLPGKILAVLLSQIEQQISNETLKLSDLEKEEVYKDIETVKKKINVTPDKVAGLNYLFGKNENGEDEVFDVEFFQADDMDSDVGYIQPIIDD